jgi:CubicO group peptidase (beta-lactamase class C family)
LQQKSWPIQAWETGLPEEVDMDARVLATVDAIVTRYFPTLLHLLIIRHGQLVFEHAYQRSNAEAATNVKSVTKSIVSALVGIALQERYLTSLDQRVEEFFPQYFSSSDDQGKREIRLRDLLTLSSGLQWVEQSAESLPALFASSNWVEHGLRLPLLHPPGEVFAYSTLDAHLLSAILTQATGMNAREFARRYLFGPLGITATVWDSDPQGYQIGGTGLYLTPRDLAKIGYLYLRQGRWEGKQLIAEDYLAASTRTQVIPGSKEEFASATYGYLWWIKMIGPYTSFYALGYGGQLICAIPEIDVVVVTTARPDVPPAQGAGPQAFALARELVERIVFPTLAKAGE